MPYLNWATDTGLKFLPFETADLSGAPLVGVYVIVTIGRAEGRAVKVGFGNVAAQIAADREDMDIQKHRGAGGLQVTWAEAPREQAVGIAKNISSHLLPLVKMAGLSEAAVAVNLPGSDVVLESGYSIS